MAQPQAQAQIQAQVQVQSQAQSQVQVYGQQDTTNLRAQPRLDFKWLKIDLQTALDTQDGLSNLWNGLIQDGELTGAFSEGLLNSSGVTARKGESGKYYCGLRVNNRFKFNKRTRCTFLHSVMYVYMSFYG